MYHLALALLKQEEHTGMANISAARVIKPVLIIILCACLPTLLLTTYVPAFSTWLPSLILGAKIG